MWRNYLLFINVGPWEGARKFLRILNPNNETIVVSGVFKLGMFKVKARPRIFV